MMDYGYLGGQAIKVMIAASNSDLIINLEAFLRDKKIETSLLPTVTNSTECLDRLVDLEPDVLLLELGLVGRPTVDLARDVKKRRPNVAVFIIVCPEDKKDMGFLNQLMGAAGAGLLEWKDSASFQNWLVPMQNAVEVHGAFARGSGADFGHLVAVHSLKGGVGRTLIATNLGASLVHLAQEPADRKRSVLLMDLNWPFGGVETFLNLLPSHSTLDLLPVMDALNKVEIDKALTTYPYLNLRVLTAPLEEERAGFLRDVIEEELFFPQYDGVTDILLRQAQHGKLDLGSDAGDRQRELMVHLLRKAKAKQAIVQLVRKLLVSARRYFDYVVVDVPPVLDELTLEALRNVERILLVCTPDVPSIQAIKTELSLLQYFNVRDEPIRFILNRVRKNNELSSAEIKEIFARNERLSLARDPAQSEFPADREQGSIDRWLGELPDDPKLDSLVNTSTLVVGAPGDIPFAAAVRKLAEALVSEFDTVRAATR